MAVNFTTNLGLAKPTEAELALNWARVTQLCDDNNTIITTETDITLTSFNPNFVAITTNPDVGAGQLQMEYMEVEGFVFGEFVIVALDPGISAGSGSGGYGIELPLDADTSFHTASGALNTTPGVASCIGEGYMTDSSSVSGSGTVALDLIHTGGVSYLRPIVETFPGKVNRWMGPGVPFTLANGDKLTGSFFYKAT